jgi:hypothetical protein
MYSARLSCCSAEVVRQPASAKPRAIALSYGLHTRELLLGHTIGEQYGIQLGDRWFDLYHLLDHVFTIAKKFDERTKMNSKFRRGMNGGTSGQEGWAGSIAVQDSEGKVIGQPR